MAAGLEWKSRLQSPRIRSFIRDRTLCWFPLGQEEKYSVPLVITTALLSLSTLHGNNELPKSGELHTSGPQCIKIRGVGVPKRGPSSTCSSIWGS